MIYYNTVIINYMTEIYDDILGTIGGTPMVRLRCIEEYFEMDNRLLAKLEFFNPGGSIKDRIGVFMLDGAEKEEVIVKGGVIVEPTSGNTGTGLAIAANLRGFQLVFTMPTKMSREKELLLISLGAHVIRVPTEVPPDAPNSYYRVADAVKKLIWKEGGKVEAQKLKEIVTKVEGLVKDNDLNALNDISKLKVDPTPFAYSPDQYHNRYNPLTHYETTGREIWRQTRGDIDAFACGIGTGGTITGIGRYLKEKGDAKIIGVDPEGSIYNLVKGGMNIGDAMGKAEAYLVEGIGEDFLPDTCDLDVVDEIVIVNDQISFSAARLLARKEGILAGGSTGSALAGAVKWLKDKTDKTMVIVSPDTGRNYLSRFYDDDWMLKNGFKIDDERIMELIS